MNTDREITHISTFYRLFFFYVEPFSALVGAIYAAQPATYISLLTLDKFSPAVQSTTTQVDIALYQLANLYLLFTLNEHFVLKSTKNLSTWRALVCHCHHIPKYLFTSPNIALRSPGCRFRAFSNKHSIGT
jgi:hypothetical protein